MRESLSFGQGTTRIFENCIKYGISNKGYNYLWLVKNEFSMRKMFSSLIQLLGPLLMSRKTSQ